MYKCVKCGKCCELMHLLPIGDKWRELLDDGNGKCKYLTQEKLCSIFENRPIVCNHKELYRKYYVATMTYEEFDSIIETQCSRIQGGYI